MNDEQFLQALTAYLEKFSEGQPAGVPIFRNGDGTLNRERILALPCFEGFKA